MNVLASFKCKNWMYAYTAIECSLLERNLLLNLSIFLPQLRRVHTLLYEH